MIGQAQTTKHAAASMTAASFSRACDRTGPGRNTATVTKNGSTLTSRSFLNPKPMPSTAPYAAARPSSLRLLNGRTTSVPRTKISVSMNGVFA
ncbi:MAG: hypothetical protein DMF97_16800 [Acidobacteria bacterium]|nr:MAG: hypothetical protein DMF97_16800 [Acidobacteriota bacterium]